RTFVRLDPLGASPGFDEARLQFVNRTLLFGITSLVVDLRSISGFIACNVATGTPVRLATDCRSSPGTIEMTRAESRLSTGTRLSKAATSFPLPGGTRTA